MMNDVVKELVKRLEEASEGSRELDGDIARLALGWEQRTLGGAGLVWYAPNDPHPKAVAPYFSSSLDAALTQLDDGDRRQGVEIYIGTDSTTVVLDAPHVKSIVTETASTPALAVCLAKRKREALRARASQ